MNRIRKRGSLQAYVTNTLISRENPDAEGNVQNPPVETIAFAKDAVDENEK